MSRVFAVFAVLFVLLVPSVVQAQAQCPPNQANYLGLQIGGYVDGQPQAAQRANVSIHARYTFGVGRVLTLVERRFCVWPAEAADIEAALQGWLVNRPAADTLLWEERREQVDVPVYWSSALSIRGNATRVLIMLPAWVTNGLPAGEDVWANGPLDLEVSVVEVQALVDALAGYRVNPGCRPLIKFPQTQGEGQGQ